MAKEKEAAVEEATENGEAGVPPEIDSKYRMIILAAQRSKQLQRGAVPKIEMDSRRHKSTRIAMREISEAKVNFDFIDAKEEKQLSQ